MKIGVIIPRVEVRGGVERALLAIVTYLAVGSRERGTPYEVVVGLNGVDAHLEAALRKLDLPGLSLRQIGLVECSQAEAAELMATSGKELRRDIPEGPWCVVRDDVCDFLDSDVWVQITTRTVVKKRIAPVVPLRPLIVFPFDLLEVRSGAGLSDDNAMQSLRATRAADRVAVSTRETLIDLLAFTGVPRERAEKLPIEFHESAATGAPRPRHPEVAWGPYALWVTNEASHKSHRLTFEALHLTKRSHPDFRCIVVGYGSASLLDNNLFGDEDDVHSPWLSALGYVPNEELDSLLTGARFLVHAAVGDNGSFTPLQAASAGTITVCSDYPAMREVASERGLDCLWFDPTDAHEFALQMAAAWTDPESQLCLLEDYRTLGTRQAACEWFEQWSTLEASLHHA